MLVNFSNIQKGSEQGSLCFCFYPSSSYCPSLHLREQMLRSPGQATGVPHSKLNGLSDWVLPSLNANNSVFAFSWSLLQPTSELPAPASSSPHLPLLDQAWQPTSTAAAGRGRIAIWWEKSGRIWHNGVSWHSTTRCISICWAPRVLISSAVVGYDVGRGYISQLVGVRACLPSEDIGWHYVCVIAKHVVAQHWKL